MNRNDSLSLKETQRLMAQMIMNPLTSDQTMAEKLASGDSATAIAEQLMKPNARLSSAERIEIYNRQYWFRLLDCLYDDFPGLRAVLGNDRFQELSVAYLQKYPSSSYSLRDLGERLVQFLEEEPKWRGKYKRAVLDIARFHWAQVVAFDGPAWKPFSPESILGKDASTLQLHLQPYLSILELTYPIDEFVIALGKQEAQRSEAGHVEPRKSEATLPVKLPKPFPTYVVVHRFENALYYKRLERPAFVLLSLLRDGCTLADACSRAARAFPPGARDASTIQKAIQGWFTTWGNLRWFAIPPNNEAQ